VEAALPFPIQPPRAVAAFVRRTGDEEFYMIWNFLWVENPDQEFVADPGKNLTNFVF
jgi:hypothetical protein